MLAVAKTAISDKDLKRLFDNSFIKYCLKKDKINKRSLLNLYRSVSEQANWNIDAILSETIQTIKDDSDPLFVFCQKRLAQGLFDFPKIRHPLPSATST